MGVQQEILDEFLDKLEKDKEFPRSILEGIRNLWGTGESISQEKILQLINSSGK